MRLSIVLKIMKQQGRGGYGFLNIRSFSSQTSGNNSSLSLPDYYKALGVKRDASLDEIKTAFRELAKVYHPDVIGEGSTESLTLFKMINEAYSVLGNAITRKEYDIKMDGLVRSPIGGASLRARNEGLYGGVEVRRPTSIYEAGPEWITQKGNLASSQTDLTGFDATSPNTFSAADNMDAFRASMTRATEKAKDNARYRASLARINRTRISVPSTSDSSWGMIAAPLAVVALWISGVMYLSR